MLCMHIEQAVHQMIFENLKETAKAGGLNSLETVGFKKNTFHNKSETLLVYLWFLLFWLYSPRLSSYAQRYSLSKMTC